MVKAELLAPAGDLEKLKIAVLYGADAVFIGGQRFSLRSRASNFTLDDIRQGCQFAHAHNAKVHVTCNIVMHNGDTKGIIEYLKALEDCGVDCIIASGLSIMKLVLKHTKMEVHVSTQLSTSNPEAVKFYEKFGAHRVVLARELSLPEIEQIKKSTNMDLEVFIHGGMCASISGRCMLSNVMTNRDANRGGCAHSCRWQYDWIENGKKKNAEGEYFAMSSKDLCAIRSIPSLMDMQISSFKIEGRMKSLHYIATVVNAYRHLIDEYADTGKIEDYHVYERAISKAENRLTSSGFLEGMPTTEQQLYDLNSLVPTKEFVGIVKYYDSKEKIVYVEQRNYFASYSTLEVFTPDKTFSLSISQIYDKDGNELDAARHPQQEVHFSCDIALNPYDLLRLN